QWRRDHTNTDCTYRRNYIRHRLLPALQAGCSGLLADELFDLSRAARGYYGLVCRRADEWWAAQGDLDGEKVALDCERLLAEAKAVRVELVRRGLAAVGCGEKAIAQEHYEKMLELAEQSTGGRRIELQGGIVARREYAELVFERAQGEQEPATTEGVEIEIPGRTAFGGYVVKTKILYAKNDRVDSRLRGNDIEAARRVERFDFDKVRLPVVVRARRDGDRFIPLGMGATKKVGKFLSDARVPSDIRRKTLVVEDGEKVIWVWPIRMSEQAKVTDRTRKILQIEITGTSSPGEGKELET
ncbi:MAG TPA: tRNA lysidine(34) synthetase TilS, partial [Sedimentisphaerales bacterium]|nr:tRNA lysidine(34) synthetase TilS [Sedimentisphaerales bacterium]